MSHPTWVRGLKLGHILHPMCVTQSHPTWVRGLKLLPLECWQYTYRRTLRGCVD